MSAKQRYKDKKKKKAFNVCLNNIRCPTCGAELLQANIQKVALNFVHCWYKGYCGHEWFKEVEL